MTNGQSPFTSRVANWIAIVVTFVWATSFIADIFVPGYDPSPYVHLVMMGIVGGVVGRGFLRGNNGD